MCLVVVRTYLHDKIGAFRVCHCPPLPSASAMHNHTTYLHTVAATPTQVSSSVQRYLSLTTARTQTRTKYYGSSVICLLDETQRWRETKRQWRRRRNHLSHPPMLDRSRHYRTHCTILSSHATIDLTKRADAAAAAEEKRRNNIVIQCRR